MSVSSANFIRAESSWVYIDANYVASRLQESRQNGEFNPFHLKALLNLADDTRELLR